ncbi:AraC family transcriptional regulator [Paenibacillus psychroresistens]|uniref:AraC family transcriptional regulator n=1 Tax=Paenibacillus psychroresistens TaxID=1778678 RepID=A0A6B8RWN1_9BACL|nr:AraC family transcriptional regulator [Paenibacillus psychroresistens]QGQ99783.1 AraC family transcriptional regulator [Paenibacillus psychroresistens]
MKWSSIMIEVLDRQRYICRRLGGETMEMTQQELRDSTSFLNEYAVNLSGKELSFYVHYWGGERVLFTNHVHKHSFFEICYIVDGEGVYIEKNHNLPLNKGTIFLSRPHIQHQIISTEGLFIIFIAFELIESESSEEAIARFKSMEKSPVFHLEKMEQSPIVMIWTALLKQVLYANNFLEDNILRLSSALLASFECTFCDIKKATKNVAVQPSSTTLVHKAKLYIRDNLSQTLSLVEVADFLFVSSRHLSRLFTDELGQSFSNYVRKERIRQAVKLFSTTEWSIKQIAEETGFDNVHYFTTIFKSEMGEPPGQFIKRLKDPGGSTLIHGFTDPDYRPLPGTDRPV